MNSSFQLGTRKISLLDIPGYEREAEPELAYCVLSRVSFGCEAGYSILPSCAIILVLSSLYFRWYL